MTHLRPVGFIDASAMTAKLILSYRDKFVESEDGIERIALIADGKPNGLCKEWKSATALIGRLRNEAAPFFGGKPAIVDRAFIERIKPDVITDWTADETEFAEEHVRVMIGLVPSPGAWVYCGGESMVLPVGQIVLANTRVMTSHANFGPCATVRLCLDVRRPEVEGA